MSDTTQPTPVSPSPAPIAEQVRSLLGFLGTPVILIILILIGLAIFIPDRFIPSTWFMGKSLWEILPFLLLSVGTAAYLKASGADQIVARAFEGKPALAIVMASIFGALSPFCSCGVVPLVAGLLAAGVPIAPVLAFCIASPIMDPEMFILTAYGLGIEFAIVKTMAAVLMGLIAGYSAMLLAKTGFLDDALRDIAKPSCGTSSCSTSGCGENTKSDETLWKFWQDSARLKVFWTESRDIAWFLGRWLAFAFLLEGLMIHYLPGEMVAKWLSADNIFALPLAVIVGVPAYLNGYAAIPLIRGLIDLGMAPSVGLSFMLAGSVSSIPAAIAVWTLVKPKLFGLYVFVAAIGSLLAGLAYMGWHALG